MTTDQPLTRKEIEFFLEQKGPGREGLIQVALQNIKKHKLPFKIEDDKLIDVGDSTEAWLSRFVTVNPAMLQMKEDVKKLAVCEEDKDQLFSVLITGETGTGKEIIARALHGDRVGEFIPINCAGLPSELVESELFGHVQGAFTGAYKMKDGLIKVANKGTLFLDEIGELPMSAQAKLLRAVQNKKIRKVGGTEDEPINCRIVCATHRNLLKQEFRSDLFARISTFQIHILPLRDRTEDVIPIIESIPNGKEFSMNHRWKQEQLDLSYNVRSLQQYIKRYKVLGKLP